MKYNLFVSLLSAAVLCLICTSEALRCYICDHDQNSEDMSCIQSPTLHAECAKQYCTVIRVESTEPKEQPWCPTTYCTIQEDSVGTKLLSFRRSCEENLLMPNGVSEDPTTRTYIRSCNWDLCNQSDGIHPIPDKPNEGSKGNLTDVIKSGTDHKNTNK